MHPDRDRLIRTSNALRVLVEQGFAPDDQVGNLRSYAAACVLLDDVERRVRRFSGWAYASEKAGELRGDIEWVVGLDVGHTYERASDLARQSASKLRHAIESLGDEIPEDDDPIH